MLIKDLNVPLSWSHILYDDGIETAEELFNADLSMLGISRQDYVKILFETPHIYDLAKLPESCKLMIASNEYLGTYEDDIDFFELALNNDAVTLDDDSKLYKRVKALNRLNALREEFSTLIGKTRSSIEAHRRLGILHPDYNSYEHSRLTDNQINLGIVKCLVDEALASIFEF